jgi:polyisoprenyl-teichoic acid--peptidoglycan teichoic acid transferase
MDNNFSPKKPGSIDGFYKTPPRRSADVQRPVPPRPQPAASAKPVHPKLSSLDINPLRRMGADRKQTETSRPLPAKPMSSVFSDLGLGRDKPKRKGLLRKKQGEEAQKKKWSWKKKIAVSFAVILVGVLGVAGYLDYNLNKLFHCGLTCDVQALNTTPLKSQNNWVNILVAGYDPSDGDITTDTIMVVSVNQVTNQAFMLSIPRDMWVNNLPGFGHQKINASNDISRFSAPGYPSGGMGELEQQVHDKLGITSDYYILVNNQAYVDAVNAIGGIDVNIQSPDPRGLYDPNVDKANGGPVNITNGWHHLDGLQALGLVKARGDSSLSYGFPNSDFDREAHARQVMVAIKDKTKTSGVLANPYDVTQLFNSISKNVQTDVTVNDIQSFYNVMKKVSDNSIKSMSVQSINGVKLLTGAFIDNLDVEEPSAGLDNYSQIQAFVSNLYSSSAVAQEGATAVVLNGTNTTGLAKQEENTLSSAGFDVASIGSTSSMYSSGMIIDQSHGKDPAAKQALQKQFPNATVTTSTTSPAEAAEARAYSSVDFVVVLGQNN